MIFLIFSFGSWLYVYNFTSKKRKSGKCSLLSLTSKYRDYLNSVVRRIELGALGKEETQVPSVIICIDELDKIVDIEEVRDFIRRIKGVFEVPGVFYYISLAEDAFAALHLGTSSGKNEIDSSFDHVLLIPALNCKEGEIIAISYLEKIGIQQYDKKLPQIIASIAYGVPRDILRLCDELALESSSSSISTPSEFLQSRRSLLTSLNYEMQIIHREIADKCFSIEHVKMDNKSYEILINIVNGHINNKQEKNSESHGETVLY